MNWAWLKNCQCWKLSECFNSASWIPTWGSADQNPDWSFTALCCSANHGRSAGGTAAVCPLQLPTQRGCRQVHRKHRCFLSNGGPPCGNYFSGLVNDMFSVDFAEGNMQRETHLKSSAWLQIYCTMMFSCCLIYYTYFFFFYCNSMSSIIDLEISAHLHKVIDNVLISRKLTMFLTE